MAVVKSNAYGHGLLPIATELAGKVDWFGVNSVSEAAQVCQVDSRTPILIMGRFCSADIRQLSKDQAGQLCVVVSTKDDILELQSVSKDIPFHLKVDTGMGRLGTHSQRFTDTLSFLAEQPELPWTGVMTHFANVEDVTDQKYANLQLERFATAVDQARKMAGKRHLLAHAAASAPSLLLPESRLDLVRVGIALYGLWPSRETKISARSLYKNPPQLRSVMRWIASVVHINSVARDEYIGYGCSYRAERELLVAVLPVGYYEGYDRRLSNAAHVMINERRARVLGRVCMNMIMVDVTDIPDVRVGSEAVLLGSEERAEITADRLAELAGTINYETTTRINHEIPRGVVQ